MSLTIKTTGFKELAEAFKELAGEIKKPQNLVRSAMRPAAYKIVELAKNNLEAHDNVRSHMLMNSIGVTTSYKGGKVIVKVGVLQLKGDKEHEKYSVERKNAGAGFVDDYAFYGRYLELGNAHEHAQPFLLPALDEGASSFLTEFQGNFKNNLEAAAAKLKKA